MRTRASGVGWRLVGAAAVVAAGAAHADEAVWNKTAAGTYDWTNAVNWLPATACPDGVGQVAGLTNDVAGLQTVQLRRNITLGTLNIGDAAAAGANYGFNLNNKSGEAFALAFDSGGPQPAALNLGSSGTPSATLSVPLSLKSDLVVNLGGVDSANRQNIAFAALTTLEGHSLVFTNGVYGQGQIIFAAAGDFAGEGTIVNSSSSTLNVDGKKAFPGRVVASGRASGSNAGTFTFVGGGFTNAAELVINGALTNGSTQLGGTMHAGHRAVFTVNPGQRWTTRQITLNGGTLDEIGQTASNNGGNPTNDWQRGLEYVRNDVATVAVSTAYSVVAVTMDTSTTGTMFNVGTLVRQPGATVYFSGPNASNKLFIAANGGSCQRGADGSGGPLTRSVIPWAGAFLAGNAGNPQTFATYVEGLGVRGLADAEYSNRVAAGASYNVSVSSLTLTEDATVNALRLGSNSSPSNIGSNRTLTVASGGVFITSGGAGVSGHPSAGTLNFGAAEGVVWCLAVNTNTIGARITGAGGLTKTGTGVLLLTGANSYTGATHVSGGTLRVGDGTYGSALGAGDVRVHAGAALVVSCADALADSAQVSLDLCGFFCGRLQIDAGLNERVKALRLGGEAMPAGTYGASGSGAATVRDDYFAGAGVLTVTGSAGAVSRGTLVKIL